MKVLVLAGYSKSLVHFRKELLIRMVLNGHEVIAVGPEDDYAKELDSIGVRFIQLVFDRLAVNPLKDVKLLKNLYDLMRQEKPDAYFGYTIKPVIYGSIAARLAGTKSRFAMVTGLGSVFIDGSNKKGYVKTIARILYRMGLGCANNVFFQNRDDINEFVGMRLISKEKCFLVNGSGVNLEYYSPCPMPKEDIFLFIGSLMGDKGIREYMKAASLVRRKRPNARCWIVGPMDNRLTGISTEEMRPYLDAGIVEYFGATEDVRPFLGQCRFYVLPSYREGTPRSVLEAMATGRPIVTTDAPGCRETVKDGVNGFLVPVRNVEILAARMLWLIDNPNGAEHMGEESLTLVRAKYDVNIVNECMLSMMKIENVR